MGDDDQAIYAWRGASVENLARLTTDYPQLKVIMLEQNYRSSVRILRSANRVIANNPKLFEKKLWSEHGLGDTLTVIAAPDEEQEAELVIRKIQAHKFEKRTKYADYAILYRGNHQARIFEQALRAQNIPYTVSGGTSLFERTEVKDLLAYFRLLINEDDDPAFIRAVTTPKRGIGATTLEKLGGLAASRHISLFGAVYAPGMHETLAERQGAALTTFCDYINRLRYRAEREPSAACSMNWSRTSATKRICSISSIPSRRRPAGARCAISPPGSRARGGGQEDAARTRADAGADFDAR